MNKYYPNADEVNAEDLQGYGTPATRQNLKRIRARFDRHISQSASSIRNRRHTIRRIGLAAASLCVLLTISITALAMSGVLELRGIYDSIFHNEAASGRVLTGNALSGSVTANGIEIQPLGAFIEIHPMDALDKDAKAYVRLKITDLEGGRLSELLSVKVTDGLADGLSGTTVESFDGDSAVVIVHVSTYGKDANDKVSLDIDAIFTGTIPITEQSLGVTIGDLIDLEQPLILPGLEFMEILGAEITGNRITISRQPADSDRYWQSIGELGLKAPDGTVLWSDFASFEPGGKQIDGVICDSDVDPADYALVIKGERPERVISGDWTVSFDNLQTVTPRTLTVQTADGQTLTISFGATLTYVTLSPGYACDSAEYKSFSDNILPPDIENPPLPITFKDGTTLPLVGHFVAQPGGAIEDWGLETAFITPLVLPQDIQSVTWMGEEYAF